MLGMAGAGTEGSTAPRRRAGRGGSGGRPRAAGVSLYRTTGTWCCVGAEPPCFWESCQALGGGLHRPERLGTSWYSGVRG